MTDPGAKILLDSVSPHGVRLTTFEVTLWRPLLAELNTHRAFCLAGDTKLEFDLPGGTSKGTRRVHRMRLDEFVDRWHHGAARTEANPKRPVDLSKVEDGQFYTASELARLVGYEKSAINIACRNGSLLGHKDGRCWVISGVAFKAWRNQRPDHTRFDISDRLSRMQIRQMNEKTGLIQTSTVSACQFSGEKQIYQLTAGERTISGSADHRLLTPDGYRTIGELRPGSLVYMQKFGVPDDEKSDGYGYVAGQWRAAWQRKQRRRLFELHGGCQTCGSRIDLHVHHIVSVHERPDLAFEESNVMLVCADCHKELHRVQGWQRPHFLYGAPVEVTRIAKAGIEPTFDLEITGEYPNFVANGFIAHNSRNAESSRAIPIQRFIDRVLTDTAGPVGWPAARKGMAGGGPVTGEQADAADAIWFAASRHMAGAAHALDQLGVHKSVVNRLLEPFLWHTVIVSATDWDNFFAQRCAVDDQGLPLAQRELWMAACAMRDALAASTPVPVAAGEWHLPLVDDDERARLGWATLRQLSASRCAGVSYLNHDGPRNVDHELRRYRRLVSADPPHWSPLEHVATPCPQGECMDLHRGNFAGWDQLRHLPDFQ